MSTQKTFFPFLQVWRGLAAALIAYGHTMVEVGRVSGGTFDYVRYPHAVGVDIFFVISGFVIVYASRGLFQTPRGWRAFLARRIARILPLYWVYTTLAIFALFLVPSVFDTAQIDIAHFIKSYFFIPHINPAGFTRPVLALGWSLNYEMYFYAIFATLLFLPLKKIIHALVFFFIGTTIIGTVLPEKLVALNYWFHPYTLEFLGGTIIGYLYLKGTRISQKLTMPMISIAIALLLGLISLSFWEHGHTYWVTARTVVGLTAGTLLVSAGTLTANAQTIRPPSWIIKLGDSSYTLYLAHPFIIGAVTILWVKLLPLRKSMGIETEYYWALAAITLMSCLIGGYILYMIIERPLLRISRRMISRLVRAPLIAPRS